MELDPKPPGDLDFADINVAWQWTQWKQEFELYTDLVTQEHNNCWKVKLLLYLTEEQGREICTTLKLTSFPQQC